MSIKAFHIFFIICAILISLIFAFWAINQGKLGANFAYTFSGCVSIAIAGGLTYYGIQFIKKSKAIV